MNFSTLTRCFMLALFAAFLAGCKPEGARPVVKIGYMLCNNEQETMSRFLPLTRYLSDRCGVDFVAVPVDTHDFEKRFKSGEFTFTHTNSLIYVILRENHGVELVASEKRGTFGSRSAGALIARKGSGIETLDHIRGKRLAFGPMLAPTGYLAEYDLMLSAGINPEHDLGTYSIPSGSFKHEKLIYGVLHGKYDVAAAPVLDLETMAQEGKISADDFVILAQSKPIPYCTFAVAKGTDPALVKKVKDALLALKPGDTAEVDGERLKVLKAAWIDGYEDLLDSDYDLIREMAKRVNMPPYQTY
ncbi:phosphate/phosphite/phosphonate ABC transporter substrate-binding protein [Geobacter sulfurreducens]|uniref:ABC transporter, periplasmic substrate-binding lipoprotein n=1 Tax=Geobacter sulfurreducens (strain ATCC 51573 / DSM 12127 / PCA) TaxID=243231 RepID=Q748U8_GEOSL|nr:phosphate/phosphite/phosphonate ABC transporter substrate-binding protein [Geobacter sulfurreducens]AAR36295.2 ABC transporter, periplasmic substrate-binding lipoprotein [Geobacter sulfurreducens PCA]UAC03584.1 phosphate/phosphite/phosphonate ABC transporter substrate-binding protein [Geobacter sulfurreducens]UTG92222.1 phosphate/phosphite/phosphonate ABC transporter substrate-binding protein [Geobacter sulfurreducens]HCD95170.1 ABC transporter substrate-binding protein [Geobacter sulfurredu